MLWISSRHQAAGEPDAIDMNTGEIVWNRCSATPALPSAAPQTGAECGGPVGPGRRHFHRRRRTRFHVRHGERRAAVGDRLPAGGLHPEVTRWTGQYVVIGGGRQNGHEGGRRLRGVPAGCGARRRRLNGGARPGNIAQGIDLQVNPCEINVPRGTYAITTASSYRALRHRIRPPLNPGAPRPAARTARRPPRIRSPDQRCKQFVSPRRQDQRRRGKWPIR